MKSYIFLADGFEEVEAFTAVDVFRRAGVEIATVSVMDGLQVCSSHNVRVIADVLFEDVDFTDADMLILPGGMPGMTNLAAHEGLTGVLQAHYGRGGKLAAICASPSVFGKLGFLRGRKATCHPGFEGNLEGANVQFSGVAVDGNVITGRSMGTALDFALTAYEELAGQDKAKELEQRLYR